MPKITGQSMASVAYDQIRADILGGRFLSEEKVKISDLVKELGFSLGAVREALSRLSSEGLVVAETNKGYRIAKITESELADLTQTRVMIESECLANAIRNGDLKWETNIVAAEFELSRLPLHDPANPERSNPAWNAAHKRFHEALVAACDSPWLLRLREMLFVQAERYRAATLPYERQSRDLEGEHRALAQATIARDAPAATQLLRDHLNKTRQILMDTVVGR
ncbi:GntR family transcriptional regulator [Paracoccus versutus]|uniref:GntR family transcriptional regulator n=1 Tax=Paracoccus versutus TaxID=34007 RepID=UPI000DF85C11|nr:FCD domain-containing protein [Paracoccus versutus]RDD70314.1 FCD domain-containing protein [Paracoccus versutus]